MLHVKNTLGRSNLGGVLQQSYFWVGIFMLSMCAILVALLYAMNHDTNQNGLIYLALINMNLLILAVLTIFMGRGFLKLFIERKKGLSGTGLNVRLLGIFSFLAVVPAVAVALFSIIFLNLGLEAWFSKRVTGALDGSLEVAQAYFQEHGNRLLTEAEVLAKDPTLSDPMFLIDTQIIEEVLRQQKKQYKLAEVSMYSNEGRVIAHTGDLAPMSKSEIGEVLQNPNLSSRLFADYSDGRIVAIAPTRNDAFLVLTRWVSPSVLQHMDRTRNAYQEYYQLRSERGAVRLVFSLFFLVTMLVVLSAAIWAAFSLSAKILSPVRELVKASNRVRSGDLNTQVEIMDDDELGSLATAFNQMTNSMAENQRLLESKNRELEARRQAMEAVLTGVSAGVMSIDNAGGIRLANKKAFDMLGVRINTPLRRYSEELAELSEQFIQNNDDVLTQQIHQHIDGQTRIILVRLVPQEIRLKRKRFVVITLEDITALLSAQRVAAWADVAQRLAHEIKNPLTPIQLSAERIRRKYSKQITEDLGLFKDLTNRIVFQVEEMREMLNEFSDFARMPAAKFDVINLTELLEEIILLEKEARTKINFKAEMPDKTLMIEADTSHLRRVFINLIENAINAIEENDEKKAQGEIKVVVFKSQSGKITIVIEDNGPGFSEAVDLEKLFDPYVTTRKKGTGLGLAIVRKIVDEHKGQIRLCRAESGGARIEIMLPLAEQILNGENKQ
mgnify:CR=1 FL=1